MTERRITGVAAWDASPAAATPMRWSEVAPPAVPRQTVVTVALSGGGADTTMGAASLTSYVAPDAEARTEGLEDVLAPWIGTAVAGIPASPADACPYDPGGGDLGAVVQLAALDALGRSSGLPATAFLGGARRSRLEAYASLPSFGDPQAALECAAAAVEAGFRGVKFHAAGMLDPDLETIDSARSVLGPAVALMWDASCAYDVYTAIPVAAALEDAHFLWFEAPFPDDAREALRALAARTTVPLVPDGLVQRPPAEWARDVADGLWGALRLDVTRVPDLRAALRILHVAEALGLPCEIQSYGFALGQHANLQLMLATKACRFFEAPFPTDDLLDGIAAPPAPVDGVVEAPRTPGLGHDLDAAELAARFQPLAEVAP